MDAIDYINTKFEVGQKVALRFEGNKARYSAEGRKGYIVLPIEKVGRKLLTLEGGIQINLETGYNKTKLSPDYQMFPSEELLQEQLVREHNIEQVENCFNRWSAVKLTNEQIKRIVDIINE